MAKWWRIKEFGGRFYPEYTQDNGQTWLRDYHVALRNGYAVKHAAVKWAEQSFGSGWWETPDTLSIFERQALNEWIAAHGLDPQDITSEEVMRFERRAEFVKWLIEHGKLSEGVSEHAQHLG